MFNPCFWIVNKIQNSKYIFRSLRGITFIMHIYHPLSHPGRLDQLGPVSVSHGWVQKFCHSPERSQQIPEHTFQTHIHVPNTGLFIKNLHFLARHEISVRYYEQKPSKTCLGWWFLVHWYRHSYFCKPPQLCLYVFYIDLSPFCPCPDSYTALWGHNITLSRQFKQNWKLKLGKGSTWTHIRRSQSCFKTAMSLRQILSCLESWLLTSNSLQDSWRSAFSSSKTSISLWN